MGWEILDDGSWNGLKKSMRAFGDEEGTVEIQYEDVSGGQVIEENKQAEGVNKRSGVWHVGHIPASVGMKWLVEEGLDMWNPDHADGVAKKLMDSDYRHLVPGMQRIIL
mgnify:FL=1